MKYSIFISLLVINLGCEMVIGDSSSESSSNFEGIQIQNDFNFSTSKSVELIFPSDHLTQMANAYQITDSDTLFMGRYKLEGKQLLVDVEIASEAVLTKPNSISGSGDYQFDFSGTANQKQTQSKSIASYLTMGSWNYNGVPDYLLAESDVFDASLANDISYSLPEGRPVPQYSPEYLNGMDMNTIINEPADIWVTFVHEGAGYRNVLGYFAFDKNNPPASINEAENLTIVFPNVSFYGSGGGLRAGNKVYLGRFEPEMTIAWFLMPNAWSSRSRSINEVNDIKYSINSFNDFTSSTYNQHTILLNDEERELLLLSFEDISRPGGDNDFNDAIFYVTANPYTAIETGDITPTKKADDVDGDGLYGYDDEFPTDPERAYTNCYPTCASKASLMFEDQWPSKGDYDFNDLVVDYKFQYVYAASGDIKEINIQTEVKAVGGLNKSSLFFNLGIDQNKVESVTGNQINYNFIKTNANGTETGLMNAVIPIFDNSRDVLPPPAGYSVTNVIDGQPHVEFVTINTKVIFTEPVDPSELNAAPHDPFIVTEFERGREIHLPGNLPTAKANSIMFNSQDDASDLDAGYTYKTALGHPWALNLSNSIVHPRENKDFSNTYLEFREWAENNGQSAVNWYRVNENFSNINASLLYNGRD